MDTEGMDSVSVGDIKYPVFSKTIFIIDLSLSGIRVILVALGAVAVCFATQDQPAGHTFTYEVGTGLLIVLFGLSSNILLLLRKKAGIPLGYLNMLATLLSCGVAVWQLASLCGIQRSGAEQIGFVIGGAFSLTIRVALIVLYFFALRAFQKAFQGIFSTPGRAPLPR